ncbi:cell cycle control protein cwf19 [Eremomyces bilateralis CBS 781.70]|uniref:Cell cycle control protein cwf19 n=1 Tax=Eremomyces bilateralis CBS 781.70 TaxID=1392243 RepID=A0A6G1G8E2_9PEZI|nr:cell cycle control protein cwf19 [Eremomyces bilateralis CBS 781.70]KAF1814304.1 cell cycle control protein cwf19 [Eremomyces bilateralis CBS 781.70]
MGLEDFEKELAESQAKTERRDRDRSRSRDRHGEKLKEEKRKHSRHRHKDRERHRHRSRGRDDDRRDRNREKRSRHDKDDEGREPKRDSKRRRKESKSPSISSNDAPRERDPAVPSDRILDNAVEEYRDSGVKRDAWMEAPSALDVDYVNRAKPPAEEPRRGHSLHDEYNLKMHKNELNRHLADVKGSEDEGAVEDESAQHEVAYEFGDDGSGWRMTKLRAVYRQAKETGKAVEEVALERFGGLREFDDAREEEVELDRRKMYGKDYVGKIKPSGELFEERKLNMGIHRPSSSHSRRSSELQEVEGLPQGEIIQDSGPVLSPTELNKLKAQLMKAKLRGGPEAAKLEKEYNRAFEVSQRERPSTIVIGGRESRQLAGSRTEEVNAIDSKRGRERGLVEENEDMSIEDMVKAERRSKGVGSSKDMAERIAKDGKFDNDLDYMDDNAAKLAKRVVKSNMNLKNTAVHELQKMSRILDACPLCHREDTHTPPTAPVVSLATRTFLTLPTEPEIGDGGAVIVPLEHRLNLIECDDDEWEEIRNFMKALTRMYHGQGRAVLFYENAAHRARKRHASLTAVPIPYEFGETAPAFFKETMLASDEEWAQHQKVIDTGKMAAEGAGRSAFRRAIAKEMPYFHVWFTLDGGLGHVVEDENRWPKGDLFAREVIGGMLDLGPEVIRRQGRWGKGDGRRVEGFRKKWREFDWTRVLIEGQ